MEPQHRSAHTGQGVSAKHTLVVIVALVSSGLLVWIIQLARAGDPVGYIILTGLGVLLVLPIVGGVLALLINTIGKLQAPPSLPRDDLKAIREAHQVLRAQNQYLTQLLAQAQKNPALLAGAQSGYSDTIETPLTLGPGQVRTPEGFVIDGTAFDTLDDDDNNNDEAK
jgi:hypothetical protein